jgi:hypothetical protein
MPKKEHGGAVVLQMRRPTQPPSFSVSQLGGDLRWHFLKPPTSYDSRCPYPCHAYCRHSTFTLDAERHQGTCGPTTKALLDLLCSEDFARYLNQVCWRSPRSRNRGMPVLHTCMPPQVFKSSMPLLFKRLRK